MSSRRENLRIEPDAGWTLEQLHQPADEAQSGDFVASCQIGSSLRVFVGDATGHGKAAAEIAADARALIERDRDLPVTVERLAEWNAELEPRHNGKFVCLTYIEIDFASRRARIANAGNPEVLVIRGGGAVEQHRATGMPLGVVEPALWQAPTFVEFDLAADDAIVCVTDGVTEQPDAERRRFGIERVLTALAQTTVGRALALIDECLTLFAGSASRADDVTMLCIGRSLARAA